VPLAYSTILTSCLRLLEKGLLERRRVTDADQPSRPRSAYVYAPRLSEEAFTQAALAPQLDGLLTHYSAFVRAQLTGIPRRRAAHRNGPDRASVERLLAYLGTLRDQQGQPLDERALDTIVALLERAEAAAQEAAALEAQVYRAAQWVEAAVARTLAAEQRAAAMHELPGTPKRGNQPSETAAPMLTSVTPVLEYPGSERICRVCGRPAPSPSARRRDGLRVCHQAACRQEACRRDNISRQRRYRASRQQDQVPGA
jgi:hypothetical protein